MLPGLKTNLYRMLDVWTSKLSGVTLAIVTDPLDIELEDIVTPDEILAINLLLEVYTVIESDPVVLILFGFLIEERMITFELLAEVEAVDPFTLTFVLVFVKNVVPASNIPIPL